MALVGARPLDTAHRLQALVAHAPVHRRQAPQLVPGIPGRNVTPVASETPGELRDDPDVVPGITRRLERPANPLDSSLAVGNRALRLRPRGRGRQDHVGELAG